MSSSELASENANAEKPLPRTPPQILGPFFPLGKEPDRTGDLTCAPGHGGRADGQMLYITGRVLGPTGKPVPGAKLTVWQANRHGRYDHPNDDNPAPLDPNFQGFTVIHADDQGRYRLKTIKPGAYPTGTAIRPSHIHFEIESPRERLLTQIYFAGDPHHREDRWLQSVRDPSILTARIGPPAPDMEKEAGWVQYDFVLTYG